MRAGRSARCGIFRAGFPFSPRPDLSHELQCQSDGFPIVAGIDEAGRGPLAGPVSVAAVVLPEGFSHPKLNDSKQLSEKVRESIYEEIISNNDMVVVDFWASCCGPCKTFAPVFETASEKCENVLFAKVNTEEPMELAGHFDIRSIPTLMVVREKIILYTKPGAVPAHSLESLLDRMLALDMVQVRDEIASAEAEAEKSDT